MNLLEAIFGDAVNEHRNIVICAQNKKGMKDRKFSSIADAATYAKTISIRSNAYFGLALMPADISTRGKASDALAIGALWADVDCLDDVRNTKNLPTKERALQILRSSMPLLPSAIVDSGHGLHAYWILKEPWLFECAEERAQAAAMAKGWHGLLCAKMREDGYHMENCGDLARVLRVPGTINYKNPDNTPQVALIEMNSFRYLQSDFEEYMYDTAEEAKVAARYSLAPVNAEKLAAAIEYSPRFADTWKHERTDMVDTSQSAYDMAIATLALLTQSRCAWTDDEIASLIAVNRSIYSANSGKANRPDYLARTINKAKASVSNMEDMLASGGTLSSNIPKAEQSVIVVEDAESADPTDQADPGDFPEALFDVPGFVTDYMQWVTSRAASPCPVATFGGALAMLSWLTGRKITNPGDCRSNFYFISIGRSGIGKNAPREANMLLMHELGAMGCYAEDIQTAEGMEDFLYSHPCALWQPDEFDVVMRNMSREDGQGNGRWEALSKKLRTFYTSPHVPVPCRVRARAKRDDIEEAAIIHQPHLVMHASATPKAFLESITSSQVQDGLLSRCTILPIPNIRREQEARSMRPIPDNVLAHARSWYEWSPEGNVQSVFPHPLVIEPSAQAREMLAAFRSTCTTKLGDKDCHEVDSAVLSRAAQTAQKASLLYAASVARPNAQALSIDAPAASWAIAFVEAVNARMLYHIHGHLADTPFGKSQLKVIRHMKEHGGSATKRDLIRLLRGEKDWVRVIDTLRKQERIEECQIQGKRKTVDGFRLTSEKSE